jgi:FANCI helical domain 2
MSVSNKLKAGYSNFSLLRVSVLSERGVYASYSTNSVQSHITPSLKFAKNNFTCWITCKECRWFMFSFVSWYICFQFQRYFEVQGDVNPPVKLDSCIVLQGDQPYLVEPVVIILVTSIHSFNHSNVFRLLKIYNVRTKICIHMDITRLI